MEELRLHWLGSPLVELKRQPVKLETRKGAGLLAYLSLRADRQPREVVATMFWPEGDQQHALACLRRTLASLNARLPGWIEADRESLSLKRTEKLWVDVETFRQLASKVLAHCRDESQICDSCRSVLEQALRLRRGDFLEGLIIGDASEFDDWQFFERDALRRELIDVIGRLTAAYTGKCYWGAAIESAHKWLRLDPLDERASRALMDLYARSGQRSAALRQFEVLRQHLADQQSRTPEPQTVQLCEHIRGLEAKAAPSRGRERVPSAPLLKTKLYIPSPPASRVVRSDLMAKLGQVSQNRLTLISAPAGFGKTSLLAEWIAETSLPVAWVSLDAEDNDPYRFLGYVVAALQSIDEEFGVQAQQMLASPQLPQPNLILTSAINDLGKLAQPFVLVLDDYQLIDERAVHDLVGYLLDHPSTGLHLVISTRADPPLQLGRLRGHGQLLELRTQDLRFTLEEVAQFLNEVMRLGLAAQEVRALDARTEGWAVGLQMAALSLRGQENPREFIQAFSGSSRFVLDYLVEEVLKRQAPHVEMFLLKSSVLDKLCGPLCDALMSEEWRQAHGKSQSMLEHLERSNLFLVPLDDHQEWFRYHHLFADLLRSRLKHQSPERAPVLHARASSWFEEQGNMEEAIQQALLARDFERSAGLLDHSYQTRVLTDVFMVQRWIEQIPAQIKSGHPWIHVSQSWILLTMGKLDGIEDLLHQAEGCLDGDAARRIDTAEAEDIRGHMDMLRAYLAFFAGNPRRTIELATLALQRVRPGNAFLRSRIVLQLGESHSVLGEREPAIRYLREAIDLSIRDRDYSVATVAYFRLGSLLRVHGRLVEAEAACTENLRALDELGGSMSPIRGKPEVLLGDLLRERGQLDAAEELLEAGHRHSELQGQPYDLAYSFMYRARLAEARGKRAEALDLLSQAEPLFTAYTNPPIVRQNFDNYRVALWTKSGQLGLAQGWVTERKLNSGMAVDSWVEPTLISLGRVLILEGRLAEATQLLERVAASTAAGQRNDRLIEALTLQAIALQAQGKEPSSEQALLTALAIAEPQGYARTFLDEGAPVIALLERLRAIEPPVPSSKYVERLLGLAQRSETASI